MILKEVFFYLPPQIPAFIVVPSDVCVISKKLFSFTKHWERVKPINKKNNNNFMVMLLLEPLDKNDVDWSIEPDKINSVKRDRI